ncbi:protein translocase component YidC [Acrocarpospora phusangensis]|uniref:Membrane protein insertase YidC n=1 Tax=Acrocarpospora phusangensis TaxID=1070424 RepID=A0A919UKE3_9ACTN|nr:membrane protein insertase YidC [Acrocarpospora phusangensis]GIH24949.1 protein translocase component YidC [Acrocarpospora phusangensis]
MFDLVLSPAYDLVAALTGLTGGLLAIVLFTVGVRLLLLPLGLRQARAQRIKVRLAPDVAELRKRFARNPERFQRELSSLYAREGTSLFAGFGSALAQLPFFLVMYRLFVSATIAGQPNLLLAQSAIGVPLGDHFGAVLAHSGLFGAPALVFLGLFALLALVAWQASRLTPETPGMPMSKLFRLLPFGTVIAAGFLPLAAGIYLLVSTAWTTAERSLRTV